MCQPGRPLPQGASHAGSPGLAPFQSAKSMGCSFSAPTSTRAHRHHLIKVAVGELAVVVLAADPEVDVAVGGVGGAGVDQMLDQLLHLGDLFGGAGVDVGGTHVEVAHIALEGVDLIDGQLGHGHAEPLSPHDHLVVDIGVVVDEAHATAAPLEVAAQHVEDHGAHGVPQMRVVVGCHAADVHRDRIAGWLEWLLATSERVVELHGQSGPL